MPARTTVISTVTKRVSSEIVKLKTSQLLQMAGRAGRRGKDTEGTVVVLRNKFEDATMGHKILTSSVDGIRSHFKTSYGLTVLNIPLLHPRSSLHFTHVGLDSWVILRSSGLIAILTLVAAAPCGCTLHTGLGEAA